MMRVFRTVSLLAPIAATLALGAGPGSAKEPRLAAEVQRLDDYGVAHFYEAREHRPLWLRDGRLRPEARQLLAILERGVTAGIDVDPAMLTKVRALVERGRPLGASDGARAELLLSGAWVEYVRALSAPIDAKVTFIDAALAPKPPYAAVILSDTAAARSLSDHLEAVSRINPIYGRLLDRLVALRADGDADQATERRLRLNLERARVLPGGDGKYVVVDASSARLWLFEDGKVLDSMKVVVGKATEQTPMAAGLIRSMVVNPYWNVPPDLVRNLIASNVLKSGPEYLRERGYQVLSGWDDDAKVLNPKKVDWRSVASGAETVRVRQLPGGANAMGAMKFMFPNKFGVYLHDTPRRELFASASRNFSSGCVRLEDAGRLAAWLFGTAPPKPSKAPEQVVPLPQPVPVYLTYLTVKWDSDALAVNPDVYKRDVDLAGSGRTHVAGR